jgi:hypothetical protein
MARVIVNQTDFTAGELTPRMKGRVGVDRYQFGAETIENGIVVVHGGVVRRHGKRYLATAKEAGARRTILVPFVYSIDQSFAVEIGHLYMRFYDGVTGAKIVDGSLAPVELVSPYTEDQLEEITITQDSEGLYLFHQQVPTQLLSRVTATRWVLVPVNWSTIPFAELGRTPDATLTLSAATVGTGRTFTTAAAAVPGAPTIGTAFPLNAAASVNFMPPASNGGAVISTYTATSSPGGITGTSASSPIRVSGLTNGVAYTFTVTATNGVGTGAASAASNSVTPDTSYQAGSITASATPVDFLTTVENGPQLVAGPTASGSGGIAPYTFAWAKASGNDAITIDNATAAQVVLSSTNYGATNYAALTCTVTDALGAQGTFNVNITIRHRTLPGDEGGL